MKSNNFLATPMHYRGVQMGNFFLAGKEEGPEFGSEDEETLAMFASQAELVVRIDAALRKWMPGLRQHPDPFVLGDLTVDYDERRVSLAGRPVHLTATEFDLLRELSVNAGRVLTHEHLLRQVWGHEYTGDSGPTRTIVKRLRRRLGDDAKNPS